MQRNNRWFRRRLLFGHRGAPRVAPENTVPGFEEAMRLGADGVEFDVQMSSDGVPVVIHDDTLRRTCGIEGAVDDFTADELAHVNAGSYGKFPSAGVPTLARVLNAVLDHRIVHVELKSRGKFSEDVFLKCVLADLAKHRSRLRIYVSSFDHGMLKRLRKLDYSIPIGFLCDEKQFRWGYVLQNRLSLRAKTLHLPTQLASRWNFLVAHLVGLKVFLWTVNDPEEARGWLKKGADGVFTDDVEALIRVVK